MMWLIGILRCTACGLQFQAAYRLDSPRKLECARCGRMKAGAVGPQLDTTTVPALHRLVQVHDGEGMAHEAYRALHKAGFRRAVES